MAHRLFMFALFVQAAAEDEQACVADGVQSSCGPDTRSTEGVAMLQRASGSGPHMSQLSSEPPDDDHEHDHGDHDHEPHRLVYKNWWQRRNAHGGLECVVHEPGINALKFASVGNPEDCLKFMLNNGHQVQIATEDGRCLQVPKTPRQKVLLNQCDEAMPFQRFTWEREQGGVIRYANNWNLVLKANHGYLELFWGGDKATKFLYNPSNADGTRIQWEHDKNMCWTSSGNKEPVLLGRAPGCDYWCFISIEEEEGEPHKGCHHIMDVHGNCLDATGGVGQALTVRTCDESEGQIFRASETGITLCSDEDMCIHGGRIGGELVVHLAGHHGSDPHNEEDGKETWVFFKDGTDNPSEDPTEPSNEH